MFSMSTITVFAHQFIPSTQVDSSDVGTNQENLDPLGRTTPQGTVKGFFKSIGDGAYDQALQYFDTSALNAIENDSLKASMVQKIEMVLNKNGRVYPINIINNSFEGDLGDGLDPSLEEVGSLDLDGETKPIQLEAILNEDNKKIWVLSSTTIETLVNHINTNPDVYQLKDKSGSLLSSKLKGATVSNWLILVFLALGSYLLAWLFTLLIKWTVRYFFWKKYKTSKYKRFLSALLVPLRLVLAVVVVLNLSRYLGVPIIVRQALGVVNLIAMWAALFIFIWLLIDALTSIGEAKLRETGRFSGLSAISFFRNTAKFVLIVVALLIGFDTIGVNVTAGLAALGVGGLALALGAQKTIENIIGGLSVVFDQPVSVGDYCKFGDTQGTVEKIGMRSTRIRTSNRTVVTIPNSDFSSRLIENFSKRDLFLYHKTIGLRYETSSDQMRYILVELRKILYAHPKVESKPARVRFLGYGADALQVELYAYTNAGDWNDFLGVQEDLNLRLAKVIEESGSGFAFPSQTLYLSKDIGLSEERKKEAELKVQQWIKNGELPLPEFDEERIRELKDSLDYPINGMGGETREKNFED